MRDSERQSEPMGSSEEPRYQSVAFHEDDFMGFVQKLHGTYPDQWVAMIIGSKDATTGLTKGTIVGHASAPASTYQAAREYHKRHPDVTVRFFTTAMAN
ncbi:MAG: hypothetical protein ACR2PL_25780 [Dehalococcoidia bacterium]